MLFLRHEREFRPDLICVIEATLPVLVRTSNSTLKSKLATVEIKNEEVSLHDWFQAKNYGDLYDAPISILISPKPIPERLKRLIKNHPALELRPVTGYKMCYARLDVKNVILTDFFPEEPVKLE